MGLKLKKKLLWNSLIRSVLTGYLKMSLASLSTVVVLNFTDSGLALNSILSLVIFVSLCQYPLSFGFILHRQRQSLQTEEMKQKYGSLYLGMRTDTYIQRLYSPIFLIRRMFYAVLTVKFSD